MAPEKKYLSPDGTLTEEFHKLVQETIDHWKVPGFALSVISGDKIQSKGYGFAKFPDQKVTPRTLFDGASTSKAFTVAAVSFLVDDEEYPEIEWTSPVSSIIRDDFVLADEYSTANVTIEDILSHRSGMLTYDDAFFGISSENPDSVKSTTRNMRNLPLSYPPRTTYLYSNTMYAVAFHMVQTVTKESVNDFLRRNLWDPLGMKETYFSLEDLEADNDAASRLARGYRWAEDTGEYVDLGNCVQPESAGAGEVRSCVHDYALWIQAMMKKSPPISPQSHKELIRPRIIVDGTERPFTGIAGYALGWDIESFHGYKTISHYGNTNGFGSLVFYIPKVQWGFVAFGNTSTTTGFCIEKICWSLVNELLDIKEEDRWDWDAENETYWAKECKEKTAEEIYPDISLENRLPTLIPESEHAGYYWNKGFRGLELKWQDEKLTIDGSTRSWPFKITLEHISGERFLGHRLDIVMAVSEAIKVKFRMGPEASISEMGIEFEEEEKNGMIWFEKVKQT